jgi:hypothetical protein
MDNAGSREFTTRTNYGTRFLFGHQKQRINSYSKEKLFELLHEFSEIGGAIPLSGWEYNLAYGQKIKIFCKDYSEYLKIAYLLPPSWYIMDKFKFKSWLHLLIGAGILENDVLPTSRGYKCLAKDGHKCNSLYEMEIDNWLYVNSIKHLKEPQYPVHKKYNPNGRYRADFQINNILIEYAGLLNDPKYALKMNHKKIIANENDIELIILKPEDLKRLDKILDQFKNSSEQ